MNHRMWDHPVAQENFAKLASLGYRFMAPSRLAGLPKRWRRPNERAAKIVEELTRMLTEPGALPTPVMDFRMRKRTTKTRRLHRFDPTERTQWPRKKFRLLYLSCSLNGPPVPADSSRIGKPRRTIKKLMPCQNGRLRNDIKPPKIERIPNNPKNSPPMAA